MAERIEPHSLFLVWPVGEAPAAEGEAPAPVLFLMLPVEAAIALRTAHSGEADPWGQLSRSGRASSHRSETATTSTGFPLAPHHRPAYPRPAPARRGRSSRHGASEGLYSPPAAPEPKLYHARSSTLDAASRGAWHKPNRRDRCRQNHTHGSATRRESSGPILNPGNLRLEVTGVKIE